ncbi:MAG: hypothetical protein QOE65_2991 [Solirubrobacteraceae bacterium]|jgi:hypothetical protein|nr:hypothetical protein [Solirubrobacteraceae bacterium]
MSLDTRRPRGQSRDTGDAEPKEGERKPAPSNASSGCGGSDFHQHAPRFHYTCPVCGGIGKLTVQRRARRGWWVNCWNAECSALGSDYLREVAKAVGAPGGGALLDNPPRWLGEPCQGARSSRTAPAALPSAARIDGWQEQLFANDDALAYLLDTRGLTVAGIRKRRIGYDGEAFTIPIYDRRGRLTNLRRRGWPAPFRRPGGQAYKYAGLAGRNQRNGGIQLYPDVPGSGVLVLCEGEFDALLLRRHGLQAITGTAGTKWLDRWDRRVRRRRLAVVYDAGERAEAIAASRAEALCRAEVDAWPVQLSRAGLKPKEDVTDWFVRYGRSAEALKSLIRVERTRYRRRRRRRHG